MDKIRKIIKLHSELGLSARGISRAVGISRPAVGKYIKAFEASGLDYNQISGMSDSDLSTKLFEQKEKHDSKRRYEELSSRFEYFVKELKRPGVTLQLLWQEHKGIYPDSYEYSRFCYHFSAYIKKSKPLSLHIEQKAGDKIYVDFTGDKMIVTDPFTGQEKEVEVFVAILGASGYTYAEAVFTQRKEDWIGANINALNFFGGAPGAIMPDCLKSAVTKADKYEPEINPEYEDFASHYDTVILPARSRKPKDKALVENAVRLVYMRIFAPLRNMVFHSLEELNTAIWEKLSDHNEMDFQRLNTSRRKLYTEIDKPALKPLPVEQYELKSIEYRSAQFNYHVYLREDKHYYSVPYEYKGKKVKIKYSARNVEIYHNNIRIAFHKRNRRPGGYTTEADHMPSTHRFFSEWSPQRFINWAQKQGEAVTHVIREILKRRKHPEQAFRSCLGILNLEKKYSKERVELACSRAVKFGSYHYKSIKNILDKGLDKIIDLSDEDSTLPDHDNVRGSEYYEQEAAGE